MNTNEIVAQVRTARSLWGAAYAVRVLANLTGPVRGPENSDVEPAERSDAGFDRSGYHYPTV